MSILYAPHALSMNYHYLSNLTVKPEPLATEEGELTMRVLSTDVKIYHVFYWFSGIVLAVLFIMFVKMVRKSLEVINNWHLFI